MCSACPCTRSMLFESCCVIPGCHTGATYSRIGLIKVEIHLIKSFWETPARLRRKRKCFRLFALDNIAYTCRSHLRLSWISTLKSFKWLTCGTTILWTMTKQCCECGEFANDMCIVPHFSPLMDMLHYPSVVAVSLWWMVGTDWIQV